MSQPEITDRELDSLVAEKVMGWQRVPSGMSHGIAQEVFLDQKGNTRSYICGCAEDFNPSTRISAAMKAEDRIAELDMGAEYVEALKSIVSASWKSRDTSPGLFGLIHATPRERCLAALKTIEDNSWRYETITSNGETK